MRVRQHLATALACVAAALLTSCSSGTSDSDALAPGDESKRIHMLAAPSGQFTKVESGTEVQGTLTLHRPYPAAFWYSDRPERESGEVSLEHYTGAGWQAAYGDVPPNATLQFVADDGNHIDGLYLSLSEPMYDEAANAVTFQARVRDSTLSGDVPSSLAFSHATLNVLNNAQDDEEVSSYVQHAAKAALASSPDGKLELMMSQAGPDMFWVDNAPGAYSDSQPMHRFFVQWSHVFGDAPPNAALVGTTPTGELRIHFMTLTDPAHNEATHELRYTATLLDEHHGALEPLSNVVLMIDSGKFTRFPIPGKGTGYQAFGNGYDPSSANSTFLYFGSDIARKQFGALWGTRSYLSQGCPRECRNDLQTMANMGINLIRLYDWDPRNDHSQFLDHAHALGIKVVVPISNWLPQQGPQVWDSQIGDYLKHGNFGNASESDWHNAIAGVIISNELDQIEGGRHYSNVAGLVAAFIQRAKSKGYSASIRVGVPVTFSMINNKLPAWDAFDRLVEDNRLASHRDWLMLCPNTYNDANYLFKNAEGSGVGWVQQTYEKYRLPILFTEIGFTRTGNATSELIIREQLQAVLDYQSDPAHADQLLGAAHFQFSNKVWKQTPNDTDSEGSFGMFRHGDVQFSIQTQNSDYTFWDGVQPGILHVNELVPTTTHRAVQAAYQR